MSLPKRFFHFLRRKLKRQHNMLTNKAEQYYFLQYFRVLEPLLKKDAAILDIGCQYGRFTIPAFKAGMKVTATDINQKYFRAIEQKIPGHSISFRHETIDQTCELLPPQSFDMILCLELLYNLTNTAGYINKLARLLNP
jgi:2-polyprenyl-3-methyl-5-hydroxy-6-metoxy-1,4-benzoquinol methylase